ncbi:Haloacid dehalogenase-like family hydrolase [Pseudomonas savastanoi pv. glycinea]|uniref:Haloacid dehalogenase-like family hydrolase n=2 Tax=Pseudomonas savastanoi pv. glycinea TaxID=318 RepID=A0A0P9RSF1_PSESG|nr:HAD-IA family hydrolase [Pseudomonas savastanoi]EFW80292.1 hydrolase, haloacid dehalogenase-like family protein [Pseudomonas savastanoi pv. glycinea str. B076]EFW84627.1 hydrolase, haloacid dehalogenase-like family protein [Pseudomonas savastanoi pv. glycinea str. race 4]KPX41617.1 Haloacid dehalogenase-like family hydrolase [Pseudomonas savastanoi pv. glycinea]MCQ3007594.1 HAD-IA family hydrolase [Pseudomonas savastanoi]PYD20113.1 HAD family hydrolase [Pseudomonas savastanoi pv. glycinea]
MISGVVFDAFGTVVRIGQRTNPYIALIREGRRQGVLISPGSASLAMTTNLSFDDLALRLGIELYPLKREELNRDLERELSSIERYPDAVEAVSRLQDAGIKVGICSNLAALYGPVVKSLFPQMDGYAFSYQLGVMKPDPTIYQSVCNQMHVEPGHLFSDGAGRVLMIGDSPRCDRDGPRAAGILGFHLDRSGSRGIHQLDEFAQLVIENSL